MRSSLIFSLLGSAQGTIVLFPWTRNDGSFGNAVDAVSGFGNTTAISTKCASALNQTVACDPQMQQLAASGYVISLNGTGSSLCDAKCNSSLVSYRNAVISACGATGAFDSYANTWRGDIIYDYFNLICDKDPTSVEYCPKWLNEQYAANSNLKLEDLPESVLCSHCQINNLRTVQGSAFLGYNEAMVGTYKKIFNKCKVNAPTTAKPPPEVNFPNSADGANRTCVSGKWYTTKPGDTCPSIAILQSVAENTLASINDLTANCGRLVIDRDSTFDLCLPKTCKTAQTGATGDCWSISAQNNITFAQFLAYNPAINADCTNLRPNGTVVCVSSPDGSYTPVPVPGSNSSWSLGEYADDVVPAPGNTPFGTTENCGAYYQVQVADTCNRISLAGKVSVGLFQAINPSINGECTNLVPELWYCVHPIRDWNITIDDGTGSPVSSTTLPPPGPTPSGTTKTCYQWHLVVSGDNCALLQNTLGVTMAQLMAWNPELKANCSNLVLGEAYCVQGPPLPLITATSKATKTTKKATTTSTKKTTTAKATAKATTRTKKAATTKKTTAKTTAKATNTIKKTTMMTKKPTATPSCSKTYKVRSGDTCYAIWTQFDLTESKFRALNPSLDKDCSLDVRQIVCVAG